MGQGFMDYTHMCTVYISGAHSVFTLVTEPYGARLHGLCSCVYCLYFWGTFRIHTGDIDCMGQGFMDYTHMCTVCTSGTYSVFPLVTVAAVARLQETHLGNKDTVYTKGITD